MNHFSEIVVRRDATNAWEFSFNTRVRLQMVIAWQREVFSPETP
jgi:hypothetical protein